MKKILFILPSLNTGGTTSSFLSIYNTIKDCYIIDVYPIINNGITIQGVNILNNNFFLEALFSKYSDVKGPRKIFTAFVKFLKFISKKIDFRIENYLYKKIAKKNMRYDVVIGFEEGIATTLASYFECNYKIAWIHCDYCRHYNCGKELNIYQRFNRIVCVSKYTSEVFISIYPELKGKVIYIYNILDYDAIKYKSKANIDDVKFSNDKFTIISVGRLSYVKRFEKIPFIARKIKERGIDFNWYILGPIFNKECYNDLVSEINKNNVEDVVFYIGNKTNPYPYFKRANILVTLSSSEACPMIFNEAKVLGIPVVTADFPSSYEFIQDGFDGRIISIEDMVNELSKMIEDKEYFYHFVNNISTSQYCNNDIIREIQLLFSAGA